MNDFENKYRDWHTKLSYVKSAVRMVSCLPVLLLLPIAHPVSILALGFFIAELVGVAEEWM